MRELPVQKLRQIDYSYHFSYCRPNPRHLRLHSVNQINMVVHIHSVNQISTAVHHQINKVDQDEDRLTNLLEKDGGY
jgi:uncharacterized membrane protein YjjP (DUF1212 family)